MRPVPREPSRRRDAGATRQRLVRAALELFTTDGYSGTTTVGLAQKAGTTEATIYRHFEGKDALLNEAYRASLAQAIGLLKTVEQERGLDPRTRLDRLGHRIVEWAIKDPAMVNMLLHRVNPAAIDDASRILAREFRECLSRIVAAGKQAGVIRPGSVDLWGAVWLSLITFVVDRVTAREWSLEHPSVGQTLDAAWAAIAYRSERGAEPPK